MLTNKGRLFDLADLFAVNHLSSMVLNVKQFNMSRLNDGDDFVLAPDAQEEINLSQKKNVAKGPNGIE